jgi:hypothetical protein
MDKLFQQDGPMVLFYLVCMKRSGWRRLVLGEKAPFECFATWHIVNHYENLGMGEQPCKQEPQNACNPYCGPCAEAHEPMEDLLHNNPHVQVQIIFTATNAKHDAKAQVRHLLAIAEQGDETVVKQTLGDWYGKEAKNYTDFATKYPMNGELKKQDEKIEAMQKWCVKTGIQFTPTFL